jgi:hypothetical protein
LQSCYGCIGIRSVIVIAHGEHYGSFANI